MSGLFLVAGLCLGAGCGGEGERRDEAAAPPAAPDRSSGGGSAPSSPPDSRAPAATPAASASSAGLTPAPAPADESAAGQAEPAADACGVLGADACGACVCARCDTELDSCLAVAGCAEILACVRDSGCSGSDCYCGDATLTECLAGGARGPCREPVLAAPGGKAPSLTDPSAGPASDAALRVADCADADDACRDVCELSE